MWLWLVVLLNTLAIARQYVPRAPKRTPRRWRPSPSLKWRMAAAQGWVCAFCADPLEHACQVDHIVPLFKGGGNERENLQILCANCHAAKTLEER